MITIGDRDQGRKNRLNQRHPGEFGCLTGPAAGGDKGAKCGSVVLTQPLGKILWVALARGNGGGGV